MMVDWHAICICGFEATNPDYHQNESTMKNHQVSCADWIAYMAKLNTASYE